VKKNKFKKPGAKSPGFKNKLIKSLKLQANQKASSLKQQATSNKLIKKPQATSNKQQATSNLYTKTLPPPSGGGKSLLNHPHPRAGGNPPSGGGKLSVDKFFLYRGPIFRDGLYLFTV
jgi:hypothetical protein